MGSEMCIRDSCDSRLNTAKACAYSCQHRLWHAGVGEFGEYVLIYQCGITPCTDCKQKKNHPPPDDMQISVR